jgi:hypothetical protein
MRLRKMVYQFIIIIIAIILLYAGLGSLLLNPQDAVGLFYFFMSRPKKPVYFKINIIIQVV